MYFYEAVRLAKEYAYRIKEMPHKEAATQLVEEFAHRHSEHFDQRRRYVERVPLSRWLLKHRVPLPYRQRWRRMSLGSQQDEDGNVYMVPSGTRRPLRDDE